MRALFRLAAVVALWLLLSPAPLWAAESAPADWEQTLERVVPAVVSLRVTATRSFDTEDASTTVGTGFVVDAERGLILTNRHMVHAGPVVAEAVFENHEEVDLAAVYRDPVHDFGLYRFDPEQVRYMEVHELALAPAAARVGMEIRVVGNDAGEKVSILDGTLARLDRNAPSYGSNTYNDFNTFYLQAASNTSGGSSGSPVVDVEGRVVALNAGGRTSAASSFYLPLQRVERALALLRQGSPVPRGTLQTVFVQMPYDEIARLGVAEADLAAARAAFPENTGMLVVSEIVPEGPGWERLEPGDVLLSIEDRLAEDFVALESVLDSSVGERVRLQVARQGEPMDIALQVGDLHAITPAAYVEAGRGVFNDLSYQQARNHNLPVRGVYVATAGYAFYRGGLPANSLIDEIDGRPIEGLEDLWDLLAATPHGQPMRVRHRPVSDPWQQDVRVVRMDRRWYPLRRCQRDDRSGAWPCENAPPLQVEAEEEPAAPFLPQGAPDRVSRRVSRGLVMVEFDIPHATAGVKDFNYIGVGTIIDADRGLVLVDRDTVPVRLGDVLITFGGSLRLPGEVLFVHPMHNMAILQYDPRLVDRELVEAVELSPREPRIGQRVWQVGLDRSHQVVSQKTRLEERMPLLLGTSSTPRYRDANVEVIDTEEVVSSLGGVLVDRAGRLVCLWASFADPEGGSRGFYGLPVSYLRRPVAALRAGEDPVLRSLGAELAPMSLADAVDLGLSWHWARRLSEAHPEGRIEPLQVVRRSGAAPARELLRDGDVLLSLDGVPLSGMGQLVTVERRERLRVELLRGGEVVELELPTVAYGGEGVTRAVSWAGLVLHEPHREVAAQRGIEPEGVYIAWLWYGSPASRYGLRPTRRVVRVGEQDTPDLDAFLRAIGSFGDGDSVRLQLESLEGRSSVSTLELDLRYWPTLILEHGPAGWTRTVRQ